MTLHPIPSEFPYLWGKFCFFFISAYRLCSNSSTGQKRGPPSRKKRASRLGGRRNDNFRGIPTFTWEEMAGAPQLVQSLDTGLILCNYLSPWQKYNLPLSEWGGGSEEWDTEEGERYRKKAVQNSIQIRFFTVFVNGLQFAQKLEDISFCLIIWLPPPPLLC
jgi:hypothetical protein